MMMKRNLKYCSTIFALLCLFTLTACGHSDRDAPQKIVVDIAPVQTQSWQDSLKTTGTLSALQGVQFKSEVAGRVTKIYFHPGQKVHTGDLLLEINPAAVSARYNAAQAALVLQEANYRRAQLLYRQKVISQVDLDTALYNKDSALAAEKAAAANLDLAEVRAPFSGTMGIELITLGSYAVIGTPLFNLEKLDQLRVDFQIPERYTAQVKLNDKVILSPGISGHVTGIDTAIDPETRMLGAQAVIDNTGANTLLPGAFAEVQWFYGPERQVLFVPQTAILDEGVNHKIYKVVSGVAHAVLVTVGQRFNDQIIIQSGLKAGDEIVTNGLVKLHDGDKVVGAKKVNAQ